ncbi:ubiquitin carboxyl-terminal hydrolase 4 [Limosa lapponica baueri]|uniref:Ubiquitin carboxyl-terminal hydrolase 4 n=1 Tax=Limosa lapponica baueri TaxID=1758121 RepID=A0A2I0UGJ6_LIMLA|nr:ubiquitin carboxyl-terminal hydrolase 4 [Limosa lapponica baueri]
MVWDFSSEQLQDPDEAMEHLEGKCCGYCREAQLTALCWALTSIYQTVPNIMQHSQGKEMETRPTDTVATPTPVAGSAAEPEIQPMPVSVAPVQKKKAVHLVKDDDEPGPSREREEEAEPEMITRCLSLSEL